MIEQRFKPAPAGAEQHLRSDFVKRVPGEMSSILPGKRLPDTETFLCPWCCAEAKPPEHGEHTGCTKCNLRWVAFGNALYLWTR